MEDNVIENKESNNTKGKNYLGDNPKNLPVISYSKLTTYKNCPKAYKFAYIEKLPRLEHDYTNFGSFCHEVLENFHSVYIKEKVEDKSSVMQTAFADARKNWDSKLTKDQLFEAYNIMSKYLELLEETNIPNVINVEKKVWLPINDELILLGYIDRIQKDDDGMLHIVDYKTTKDPKFLKDRTQLLLYAYSQYIEDSSLTKIRSSYILLKHNMKSMIAEHDIDELIKAKDKLIESWHKIQDDKLFRATPLGYKCKNCDFLKSCKEGQKLTCSQIKFGKIDW